MAARDPPLGEVAGMPTMLVENNDPKINFDRLKGGSDSKRRTQLFVALALLFAALVLVILRNRQFWMGTLSIEEAPSQVAPDTLKKNAKNIPPASSRKGAAKTASSTAQPPVFMFPGAHEAVLAPLQVDVTYSSGKRETLIARDSAIRVDLTHNPDQPDDALSNGAAAATAGSGDKVRFSPQTAEVVLRRVDPVYPVQAQQANIQGSVVLQARIDKDGNVQSVQVVSGPAILTKAALEAVKQWRFKPHYEGDQVAPTETRITVNFTISAQ